MKTKTVNELVEEYKNQLVGTEYAEISILTPSQTTEWKYHNVTNLRYERSGYKHIAFTWIEFDSLYEMYNDNTRSIIKQKEHVRIFGYITRFVVRKME